MHDLKYAPLAKYVALTGLLLLNGCATKPQLKDQPAPPNETVVITKPLESNIPVITASELKQPEAPALSREQMQQRLGAIDTLIRSGEFEQAKKLADGIEPSQLSDQELSQLNLLYAQINLSMGEAERALDNLKQIQPHQLNQEQKIKFLQAQAFAFSLSGDFFSSVKSRIELIPLLISLESQDQNQRAILETLSLLNEQDLANSPQSDPSNMIGWMALSKLYKLRAEPDFEVRLSQWREAFPNHPANLALLTKSANSLENSSRYPGSIAIMLPGSGSFAEAGRALKAGLMAAFANLKEGAYKPNLQFYDTTEATPVEQYRQAIAAGAEFIIGPLEKKDIQSLADSTSLEIPVLALNHIQNLEQDNLYQFALSPMDDVEQITERARLDGHKKAVLLLPENSQTQRVIEYFKQYWTGSDRVLLKTQTYSPRAIDFSSAIQLLLNRAGPSFHSDSIQSVEINYPKPDSDVIFISAYSAQARTIMQQLNVNEAGEVAVYALPNVYSGQINPVEDQILSGITFCDMPWFFNTADQGNLSMKSLASVWQQFPSSYLRLIAMGIDAFHLSGRLNDLNSRPYLGATGKLSLAEDNRIKRDLLCAKFTEGQPRVTDSINQPSISGKSDLPTLGDIEDNEINQPENTVKDDLVH